MTTPTYRTLLHQSIDLMVREAIGEGPIPREVEEAIGELHSSIRRAIGQSAVLQAIFDRWQADLALVMFDPESLGER